MYMPEYYKELDEEEWHATSDYRFSVETGVGLLTLERKYVYVHGGEEWRTVPVHFKGEENE